MKVSDFNFELPPERVAQHPLEQREQARLMVVERATGRISHHYFYELGDLLAPGDLLVLNNTRVLRARLLGRRLGTTADPHTRKTQITSPIEVLLVKELQPKVWEALVNPGRKMRVGEVVVFGDRRLRGEVIARSELGLRTIRFDCAGDFIETVQALGHVPLPPYIRRADSPADAADYQTVYARQFGAVAAPTAGLHFTEALLKQLRSQGIEQCQITLHVGLGTFRPVYVDTVEQHVMHSERFEVPLAAAEKIEHTRRQRRRVVAVGTTAVRSLESVAREHAGRVAAACGETDIFIYPGFAFQASDAMITNFHLPRSTLLMLVAAFAGRDLIFEAYRIAIQKEYRFFSYGDAMLIL